MQVALLAGGPRTTQTVIYTDGSPPNVLGAADRKRYLDDLTRHLHRCAAQGPLWPGDGLVTPPTSPERMPYQLFQYPDDAGRE